MSTIKFKFFWIFRNFIPKPQFNSQDRTPRVRFRPLQGSYLFSCRLKVSARGRGYRFGLLRQGQLSEPQASSGPAAMLLAISRNLSCIPRRSPCPGRYPLPLASGFLSTSQPKKNATHQAASSQISKYYLQIPRRFRIV